MSSSEAAMNKQKEDQEQELDIGEFKLKIEQINFGSYYGINL